MSVQNNRIAELLPEGLELLYKDIDEQECIKQNRSIIAENAGEVLKLAEAGVEVKKLYYLATKEKLTSAKELNGLKSVLCRCRIVADGMEALRLLNNAVCEVNEPLHLQAVGIYVRPGKQEYDCKAFGSFNGITVRGCFVDMDLINANPEEFRERIHEAYQVAKRLTVDVPCAMPYMCFVGAGTAALRLKEQNPEDYKNVEVALETVAMQNATAFYSKFLTT